MKKVSLILIILMVALLTGCSGDSDNQKTEEELKAEIKAELKAEMEAEAQNLGEEKKEEEQPSGSAAPKENENPVDLGERDSHNTEVSAVVNAADLAVGDEIDGHVISEYVFKDSEELTLGLEGSYEVEGAILYSEYDEGWVFSGERKGDETTIQFLIGNDPFNIIPPYSGMLSISAKDQSYLESLAGEDLVDRLKGGNQLNVKMIVENYRFYGKTHSTPYASFDIVEVKSFEYDQKVDNEAENGEPSQASSEPLIETNGTNFYKFKANETVSFDLNNDGVDEEIYYNSDAGSINVKGFDAIPVDFQSRERDYFLILKYSDSYATEVTFHMIGIVDYGPSGDYETHLYAIIEPMGEEWFGTVGSVPGEVVDVGNYDDEDLDDFNYKAVVREGEGIDAPVRLGVLPQTWWGRSLFIFHVRDLRLVDWNKRNSGNYVTRLALTLNKNINAYKAQDLNADRIEIAGNQNITVVATDNKEWISIMGEDGTIGWVHLDQIEEDTFSGFRAWD